MSTLYFREQKSIIGQKNRGYTQNYLDIMEFFFTFDPTNQIFLPIGCLVFIKKGGEIRL